MPRGKKKVEIHEEPEVKHVNVPHRTVCKECGHGKELHYEGPKGWCNAKDCPCQEHK